MTTGVLFELLQTQNLILYILFSKFTHFEINKFGFFFFLYQLYVMQHVELTMVNMQLINTVASLETREGCPITPGHSFTKQFLLTPLAANNVDKRGVALDGHLKVIQTKKN